MSCPYEMMAKRGTYKGMDICALSGCPCLENDPRNRPGCDRLVHVQAYLLNQQVRVTNDLRGIVEATEQGKLL